MSVRSKKPKCDGSTSQSCGMGCISREHTCRELIAADVATRLLSVAKQHQQPNDASGQSFDSIAANFPPNLLAKVHNVGVATRDLGNGATLTTKVATGLDGSSIKYGFVTDADGKRYTVSDGLVKEVTSADGSEWQEAFDAAVRSKVAETTLVKQTTKPVLPDSVFAQKHRDGVSVDYKFKVQDVPVELSVFKSLSSNEYTVDFSVDDNFTEISDVLSKRDAAAIAIKLAKIITYDASKRAEGFQYKTSAVTSDGQGAKRSLAYERLGFSRPTDAVAGGYQYGTVKDGKLTPDLDKLATRDTIDATTASLRMAKLKQVRAANKTTRVAKTQDEDEDEVYDQPGLSRSERNAAFLRSINDDF